MSPRRAPTASLTDTWARRSGQEGAKRWTGERRRGGAGLGCRTGLCRWRKGPWRVALVSDDRRLAEACGSADIVLSTVDAQGRCRGPRLVIDRRDAWREGAQALWLDETGVRRETANAPRGDRPWVPGSSDASGRAGEGARADIQSSSDQAWATKWAGCPCWRRQLLLAARRSGREPDELNVRRSVSAEDARRRIVDEALGLFVTRDAAPRSPCRSKRSRRCRNAGPAQRAAGRLADQDEATKICDLPGARAAVRWRR